MRPSRRAAMGGGGKLTRLVQGGYSPTTTSRKASIPGFTVQQRAINISRASRACLLRLHHPMERGLRTLLNHRRAQRRHQGPGVQQQITREQLNPTCEFAANLFEQSFWNQSDLQLLCSFAKPDPVQQGASEHRIGILKRAKHHRAAKSLNRQSGTIVPYAALTGSTACWTWWTKGHCKRRAPSPAHSAWS